MNVFCECTMYLLGLAYTEIIQHEQVVGVTGIIKSLIIIHVNLSQR